MKSYILCEYNHTCIRVLLRTLTEESQSANGQIIIQGRMRHLASRRPIRTLAKANGCAQPHCRARGLWSCAGRVAGGKLATHGGQWDMDATRVQGEEARQWHVRPPARRPLRHWSAAHGRSLASGSRDVVPARGGTAGLPSLPSQRKANNTVGCRLH